MVDKSFVILRLSLSKSISNPLVDLQRRPTYCPFAQTNGLRKLSLSHQCIDVSTAYSGPGLNFGASDNALLTWYFFKGSCSHNDHSMTLNSVTKHMTHPTEHDALQTIGKPSVLFFLFIATETKTN
jgi:hypothetical protein